MSECYGKNKSKTPKFDSRTRKTTHSQIKYEAHGYSGASQRLKIILENKQVPNSLKDLEYALFRINQLTDKIKEMERSCDDEEITEKRYQALMKREEEQIKSSKLKMQLEVEPKYKKYLHASWTHDFERLELMDNTRKTISTNLLALK